MNRKCPKCGNVNTLLPQAEHHGERLVTCLICGQTGRESTFPGMTLFDQITASPEVLAENIVYEEREHSVLTEDGIGAIFPGGYTSAILDLSYGTKAEAIAATVAKLKEVEG